MKSLKRSVATQANTCTSSEYNISATMITVNELSDFKYWLLNESDLNHECVWDLIFGFINTELRTTMKNIKIKQGEKRKADDDFESPEAQRTREI